MTIEQRILDRLDTEGGFTAGQLAKKLGLPNYTTPKQFGARVRHCLEQLSAMGQVSKIDDLKPAAWVKTIPKPPAM